MSASQTQRNRSASRRRARQLSILATLTVGAALATTAGAKPTPPVNLTPATPHAEVTGAVQWSDVSGETAPDSFVLGPKHKRRALWGIGWWEHSDEPCKFEVYAKDLDGSGLRRFNDNGCKGSPGSKKGVNRNQTTEFITGVEVCLTDKKDPHKDKLKGLKLYGRIIDPSTGALGGENGPDIAQRPHCKEWSDKVTCPAGHVATKLEVFHREQSKDHVFATGVRLGCREVTYVEPFAP